jgi:hypothetical protein
MLIEAAAPRIALLEYATALPVSSPHVRREGVSRVVRRH